MQRLLRFFRWLAAGTLMASAWLVLGLPAIGMLLGTRAPVPLAPRAPLAVALIGNGEIRTWDDCRREPVGLITHVHLTGDAQHIGTAHGLLAGDLITALEGDMTATFVDRVPSFFARHMILGLVSFNNRSLFEHFTADERLEISASTAAHGATWDSLRCLGPSFSRGMQYHALHDVSQYLIDNPLVRPIQVGCTAVAVGGARSRDGHLLVGRLFDFEGGPRFDQDKVVFTVEPDHGYPFMHVCWGGMSGGVTGLNQAGLWVSINAAATAGQSFVGRPIVMVVRDVLQHCRTIDEAIVIIKAAPVFVSDGVLLASRDEQKVVVVEKGPTGVAVRAWQDDSLVSTNHFLAPEWDTDARNHERIVNGTTTVRMQRVNELLARQAQHDPESLTAILRDHAGLHDAPVGFGNRSTINAWIGAHLVVADITAGIVWVSEPWHGLGMMRPFDVHGPLPGPTIAASPEMALLPAKIEHDRLRAEVLAHLHNPDAAGKTARMRELNPDGFEAAWLSGLTASDPVQRTTFLKRALTLQPAYPADQAAISSALAGGSDLPGDRTHQ